MAFEEKSYALHREWYDDQASEEHFRKITQFLTHCITWADKMSYRLFQPLLPLCQAEPGQSWLTVGDGKYGIDAKFLLLHNQTALASDIAEPLLKYAYQKQFIPNYTIQNAEKLTFEDNSFDYVLCKEAYHHFPRPYLALYEMLRVAKKGIVLIEPQDMSLQMPLLLAFLNWGDSLFPSLVNRIYKNRYSFEEVGNFVYKVSRREMEKVALGLGLRWIAFQSFYFGYTPQMHTHKWNDFSWFSIKRRSLIHLITLAKKLKLIDLPMLATIIFKTDPPARTLQNLKSSKFEIRHLPQNPFACRTLAAAPTE
ncbi:MAG: methyltransferase domain-containing protein [Bacteroidia bacterium]|nr:class I SAM-dependent methyltransferase [Bacteroidia bacterium]MDW8157454.1 methyltransferase domain-containing protein [Bacteroidia bacterium]